SLAQQDLDVAVVAAAADESPAAQVIDAAVADMAPPGGALLHETERAGGARALLEGQRRPELDDFLVRAAEDQVQEALGIEQRVRRVGEGVEHYLAGDLRGARTVGVAAHAVGHEQQRRMLRHRGGDPVLVLLAPADEADVGVLNPQEEIRASVRLWSLPLYHPGPRGA